MAKIKAAVIGTGPRGRYLFSELIKKDDIIPYAVCDADREKVEEFKVNLEKEKNITGIRAFTSYEDLLKTDVEAVIVATNVDTHADIACDCLYAGKHVLCEIPNIASIDDAKKLYKAVKDNPTCKFMVAENCCYWAFIQSWKKMYEDGLLGEVVFAESDYLHQSTYVTNMDAPMTWRSYLPSVKYLTHNLGPLLYILGDTCDEISGFVPDINPIAEKHPAPANGVAMIKTKKGTMIKIFIGFGMYHDFAHNFILYGSKGSVENQRQGKFEDKNTIAYLSSVPYSHNSQIELPIKVGFPNGDGSGHGGADGKMMGDFVDCLVNDKEPALGIEFGINIALPGILADISSHESGKTYKMPDLDELLK